MPHTGRTDDRVSPGQHPERITAIVSQNGNAYEEGVGELWEPIKRD